MGQVIFNLGHIIIMLRVHYDEADCELDKSLVIYWNYGRNNINKIDGIVSFLSTLKTIAYSSNCDVFSFYYQLSYLPGQGVVLENSVWADACYAMNMADHGYLTRKGMS